MTLRTRYLFFRKTYPDTLLIFLIKEKYVSFDIDYEIFKYLQLKKDILNFGVYRIDFVVIDNNGILESSFYSDNQYGKYVCLIKIKRYLDDISYYLLRGINKSYVLANIRDIKLNHTIERLCEFKSDVTSNQGASED